MTFLIEQKTLPFWERALAVISLDANAPEDISTADLSHLGTLVDQTKKGEAIPLDEKAVHIAHSVVSHYRNILDGDSADLGAEILRCSILLAQLTFAIPVDSARSFAARIHGDPEVASNMALIDGAYKAVYNGDTEHVLKKFEETLGTGVLFGPFKVDNEKEIWTADTISIFLKKGFETNKFDSQGYTSNYFTSLFYRFDFFKTQGLWQPEFTQRLITVVRKYGAQFPFMPGYHTFANYFESALQTWPTDKTEDLMKAALPILFGEMATAYKNILKLLKDVEMPLILESENPLGFFSPLAGGKWAGLMRAKKLGINTVDGFCIPVFSMLMEAMTRFPDKSIKNAPSFKTALKNLEEKTGKKFGDVENPLLLAVRSGAPVSFPGELATVTNVGMNDAIFETLKQKHGEEFAVDTYCRFMASYAVAVFGMDRSQFAEINEGVGSLARSGRVSFDKLLEYYKNEITEAGFVIPDDSYEQLKQAIFAVDQSGARYLAEHCKELMLPLTKEGRMFDTAITINEMRFGNLNDRSGSGVIYSRSASTGEKKATIDYLSKSQGEDLMSKSVFKPRDKEKFPEHLMPQVNNWILKLEKEYGTAVQIEFCVVNDELILTQSRSMTAAPEVLWRINKDLRQEGVIDKITYQIQKDRLPTHRLVAIIPEGVLPLARAERTNAIPIAGKLAFTQDEMEDLRQSGIIPIVFRNPKYPDSLYRQVKTGEGLIDNLGGWGAHLMDRLTQAGIAVCIIPKLIWDEAGTQALLGNTWLNSGDPLTLFNDGKIYPGKIPFEQKPIQVAAEQLTADSIIEDPEQIEVPVEPETERVAPTDETPLPAQAIFPAAPAILAGSLLPAMLKG